mgnify:CR=1 FL=1
MSVLDASTALILLGILASYVKNERICFRKKEKKNIFPLSLKATLPLLCVMAGVETERTGGFHGKQRDEQPSGCKLTSETRA